MSVPEMIRAMARWRRAKFPRLILCGSCLAVGPGLALAQAIPEGQVENNPIVVTGERVARDQMETSSSVSVITADTVEAASADRLDQVIAMVPNVQLGSGEEGPAIRGQDSTGQLRNLFAFLGGARPRVTLQIDGRPASFYEFISGTQSVWDVAQVEVFRSPQTTTQGRNAIAGGIFVTTSTPGYDWEARSRTVVAEKDRHQLSALVSGPIVEDELAFRIAGDWFEGRTASDMADGIAEADINDDRAATARVKMLYEPREAPGLRIEGVYAHAQSRTPQFEGVTAPFKERKLPVPQQTIGVMDVRADSLTLRAVGELGRDFTSTLTVSTGDVRLQRFGLPGLGRTNADTRDYSAEAIFNWQPTERIALLIGTSRLHTRQDQFIDITGLGIGTGNFNDRQDSFGLFGEATWNLAEPLTITAGLRYQRDRQQRLGTVGAIGLNYDGRFDAFLPKFSVALAVADNTIIGLTAQRAFNPGGTSISLVRQSEDSFASERLWNFEVFSRTKLADDTGWLTVNAFYNKITDAQRQQLVPLTLPDGSVFLSPEFANAPSARTWGLEFGSSFRLLQRLTLGAGIGLLQTEIRGWVLPEYPDARLEFERSPDFSGSITLDWKVDGLTVFSAHARHQSGYFSGDQNSDALRVGPSTVVDARIERRFGRITLFGFARNLFDRFYMTYLFDTSRTPNAPPFGTAGAPREAGIGVDARF
ncbi:TonB-dependent receptor [Croceicoccus bisphenolivorans]|uniref:TonB-dependent receptor n=1 Tax=Croceicoccus bisphenolivorans TaxID=1783232 RepID=UPI000AF5BACE|nr:TonB-dependent receptor [Croceicoccus bisphenolivorans]